MNWSSQFLGQNLKSNTFQLHYDFTSRISARLGYEYTSRSISDFTATWDTGEIYFPGGGGTAGFLQGGTSEGELLPRGARGLRDTVSRIDDTSHRLRLEFQRYDPRGFAHGTAPRGGQRNRRATSTIFTSSWRCSALPSAPTNTLRINADFDFGSNDNSFTRISPRELQVYKVHGTYTPKLMGELYRRR